MRRACYCKTPEGYQVKRLRSIQSDGHVTVEDIQELKDVLYKDLAQAIITVNSLGYGVLGDIEDIRKETKMKAYKERCGNNMMDVDDL